MQPGILDSIRIVDMTSGLAGPMATQLLAEQGADVIKVESSKGDWARGSAGFASWNRSKKAIIVELDKGDDGQRLRELLAGADVLVHGLRPSRAQAVGLDDATLSRDFPQLIVASVLGYPVGHPDENRPADDILVQARSGAMDEVMGNREGPIFLRFPLPSWAAVYLVAIGIVARLIVRDRTGRAGAAHTSLYQGMMAVLTMLWNRVEHPTDRLAAKVPLTRGEPGYALSMFDCADGKWLQTLLGYTETPLMLETLALMGEEPIFVEGHTPTPAQLAVFRRAFRTRTRDEWLRGLSEGDVPAAPCVPLGSVFRDPQVLVNDYTVELDDPVWGRVRQAGAPFRTEPPSRVTGPAPALGQHDNAAVLWKDRQDNVFGSDPYPRHRLLEGLKVLDLGMYIAGPYGPMLLSDLGADVIKVEPPSGDRMRHLEVLFLGTGRGRRSVALDLASPASRPVLERLVRWADVVHHNLRISAARRLAIDYDALKAINADIIYSHVSGYGDKGEKADWPSYDATAQAISGWGTESVQVGEKPMVYRFGMFDPLTGMASVLPTLLALYKRGKGGTGGQVTTSLLGRITETNSETMLLLDTDSLAPVPKIDADQTGLGVGYRIYPVAEGQWIAVAATDDGGLAALRSVAGVSADEAVEAALADREAKALLEDLDAVGVPAELVRQNREAAFFNEETVDGGIAVSFDHPEYGHLEQPGVFWSLGEELGVGDGRPAPLIGQHTVEVFEELGFDAATIRQLMADGVAAQASSNAPVGSSAHRLDRISPASG